MVEYNNEFERNATNEFRHMRNEIMNLLNINNQEQSEKVVEYFYYKNPYKEYDGAAEKELIAFTRDRGLIIQAKPIYNEDKKLCRIESSIFKIKDIQKLVPNVDFDDNTNISLGIEFRDSSVINLKSTDVNDKWKFGVSAQIKNIQQYILNKW